jgi:tetratricopeptide (TPR) repeat protein
VVILFFVVVLVLMLGGTAILPLLQSLTAPSTSRSAAATNTVETTATLAAKYAPRIAAVDAELKKDAKSYDLLITQADAYQQWASDVQQATQKVATTDDTPLWLKSLAFYKRAAAVKALDANSSTDMSVAQFFSGDPQGAIAAAQRVVKSYPKFAPVHFDMGLFYSLIGDSPTSIAEYQRYLALDPKGQWAAEAQTRIAALNKQPASTPGTSPTASIPASGP